MNGSPEQAQDKAEKQSTDLILPSDYQFLELIGSGGFGTVVKARQVLVGRLVAIKILKSSFSDLERARRRFLKEAQATARLHHPNIVTPLASGVLADGNPFIVYEYIQGQELGDYIRTHSQKDLTDTKLLSLLKDLLDAVGYAHSAGIVHRDLKPANILVYEDADNNTTLKVLDFGIAKTLDSVSENNESQKLTKTGEIFGSPGYVSPELCLGKEADQRSDLYSIACMIYFCLSGKHPFEAESAPLILFKQLHEEAQKLEPLPGRENLAACLQDLITRGLEKSPESRWQSALEIKTALEEAERKLLSGEINTSKASSGSPRSPGKSPLSIILAATFVIICLLVVLVANLSLLARKSKESTNALSTIDLQQRQEMPASPRLCLLKAMEATRQRIKIGGTPDQINKLNTRTKVLCLHGLALIKSGKPASKDLEACLHLALADSMANLNDYDNSAKEYHTFLGYCKRKDGTGYSYSAVIPLYQLVHLAEIQNKQVNPQLLKEIEVVAAFRMTEEPDLQMPEYVKEYLEAPSDYRPKAWYSLAKSYERQAKIVEAQSAFENCLNSWTMFRAYSESRAQTLLHYLRLLKSQGKEKEAAFIFDGEREKIRSLTRDNDVRKNMIESLMVLGEYELGLADAKSIEHGAEDIELALKIWFEKKPKDWPNRQRQEQILKNLVRAYGLCHNEKKVQEWQTRLESLR